MVRQYIPEIFQGIVTNVSASLQLLPTPITVYFDYGHYREVANKILEKDRGVASKETKYPIIWLVMDYVESYGNSLAEACRLPNLQIIIATPTEATHDVAQRMEENFKPILYPIYDELLSQIAASHRFNNNVVSKIKHEKIDRPYWGGQDSYGNGTANLFNDYIDAIQIRNLELSLKNKFC